VLLTVVFSFAACARGEKVAALPFGFAAEGLFTKTGSFPAQCARVGEHQGFRFARGARPPAAVSIPAYAPT
jgi:hypothetical protein